MSLEYVQLNSYYSYHKRGEVMGILENTMGLTVGDALMDKLRLVFPDRLPRKKDIQAIEVARIQGQQDVLDYLLELKRDQDEQAEATNKNLTFSKVTLNATNPS